MIETKDDEWMKINMALTIYFCLCLHVNNKVQHRMKFFNYFTCRFRIHNRGVLVQMPRSFIVPLCLLAQQQLNLILLKEATRLEKRLQQECVVIHVIVSRAFLL